MDNLENHIDIPIKKSVVGMALLGFRPIFSCCGFNYVGEKVKKSHMTGKPYIYIEKKSLNDKLKALLLDISIESNWTISQHHNLAIDFHGYDWPGSHPWKKLGSPHRAEAMVCSINALEKVLESKSSLFNKNAVIDDGNWIWIHELGTKYWQYSESSSWFVTPEIFNNL